MKNKELLEKYAAIWENAMDCDDEMDESTYAEMIDDCWENCSKHVRREAIENECLYLTDCEDWEGFRARAINELDMNENGIIDAREWVKNGGGKCYSGEFPDFKLKNEDYEDSLYAFVFTETDSNNKLYYKYACDEDVDLDGYPYDHAMLFYDLEGTRFYNTNDFESWDELAYATFFF